jgi:transposase
MPRLQLTDELWSKLSAIILGNNIYNTIDLRINVEGILYKLRVGCPWRDLPSEFGNWNAIFKRFNNWCLKGKLKNIFQALSSEPDHEWTFVDGTIVKAHQHSSGAIKGSETAIGKSVAGNSTKIHMAVEAFGLPIYFETTGGYDSEPLREKIADKGAQSNIPRKSNSHKGNYNMDWCLYKYRHLVENAFARLKHFRSIATRFEKLKRNYDGMIYLACSIMWLPM